MITNKMAKAEYDDALDTQQMMISEPQEDNQHKSLSSVMEEDQNGDELIRQQDIITKLQLQLEIERESRSEAVTYARQMKEKQMKMLNGSSLSHNIELAYMDTHAKELEMRLREKEETEARLKAELVDKTRTIEELQRNCTEQEKIMKRLRADLKTLMCNDYVYSSIVKSSGLAESKKKDASVRRSVHISARGA